MPDDNPTVVVQQTPQGAVAVAGETVSALKGSPILLVLVLLNIAFLGSAAYYLKNQQDNAFKLVDEIFNRCLPRSTDGTHDPPR
jgi:hypothetical protein